MTTEKDIKNLTFYDEDSNTIPMDFLNEMLYLAIDESDFVKKVTYGYTNENNRLDEVTENNLHAFYKEVTESLDNESDRRMKKTGCEKSHPLKNKIMKQEKASETQIGGSHYSDMAIQPIEFIHKNGLSFIQGNVIKYVCRYKSKGGIEDLNKAKHCIDLLIEFEEE